MEDLIPSGVSGDVLYTIEMECEGICGYFTYGIRKSLSSKNGLLFS